jgi:hypothetical protein
LLKSAFFKLAILFRSSKMEISVSERFFSVIFSRRLKGV